MTDLTVEWPRAIKDGTSAISLIVQSSWRRLIVSWIYVPIGVFLVLLACWGIDSLIRLSGKTTFPASVACMLLLYFGLVAFEACFGDRRTRKLLNIVDVPAGFALRYINVFFTPSFILLPLSTPIGGIEIGKIIAVFSIGFLLATISTSYLIRTLQILFKPTKRSAEHDQGEPLQDLIPLTNTPQTSLEPSLAETAQDSLLQSPLPAAETTRIRGPGPEASFSQTTPITSLQQQTVLLSRPQAWAAYLSLHLDIVTYTLILVVGVPVAFIIGYALPLHVAINVLSFFAARSLSPKITKILHPVLGCSLLTLLSFYTVSLILRQSLFDTLQAYSTGTRYLSLFRGQTKSLPLPGAGDIFASVLDVSIVALALPMYTHRDELRRHFPSIVIPGIVLAVGSVFTYPAVCHAIGIEARRSLSFTARSLTLALATPSIRNLDGDMNLVAVLCITSGILGVLIGGPILKFLRVPEGDYVTRGVTLGMNSTAITTAHLLVTDPRAAALSSLAMVVFGTGVVALTAVPPVVNKVREIVGGL
ncbi:hypothetical protein L873DRAFT_1778140 [Choiromyces venosus 120613-1]|uniref:LrgB-domain-containing protein n=1 Tax=Choiromyces venosus 120613-1 TaxID=1336337 RepID=A0A3N4JH00_9PEZI|nr:hypothetical protein L873DRAFT_1778140 [Choiromyces venosus 120613-1]